MLGHLIYSFNHVDDACIQQEISRVLYAPKFGGVKIVHAHNGEKKFGYKKYLEDVLIRRKNPGHFEGAADLIDSGMHWFIQHKVKGLRYVLVTAADTWCLNADWLKGVVGEMESAGQVLVVSSWGHSQAPIKPTGFSTDFLILDLEWARKAKVFPLNYPAFRKKFTDLFLLQWSMPTVEACLQWKFLRYFFDNFVDNDYWKTRNKSWRRLSEREPIHVDGQRQADWPKIGLYTDSEDPRSKQSALRRLKLKIGPCAEKLKESKDLSYYNLR